MRIPRIKFSPENRPLDHLLTRWPFRYGVAIVAVAIPTTLGLLFGDRLGVEFYLLLLFGTILVASVVGGLGPGLLATVLAAVVSYEAPHRRLSLDALRLLMIEGTLVSVGGTLRAALIKARERQETNFRLEQQILEIGDEDRRRIGHDLHDGLGQHLTGISLLSETMSQQLATGKKPDAENVEHITRLVSEAVGITRNLAKSLSPITLELDGLPAAIIELADTSSLLLNIHCTCDWDQRELMLDRKRALHVFRIVQEAVNNAVRHGKAKNVGIKLARDSKTLTVSVIDDGIGLSSKTRDKPGIGLRIMLHRAKILGAALTAERDAARGGTVVQCVCPLDGEARLSLRNADPAINADFPRQIDDPAR